VNQKISTYKKLISIIYLSLLLINFNKVNAQELDKKLSKEFLAAKELYLINSPFNTIELTSGNGRKFTFEQLVQENWPDKKIVKIDKEGFNDLKNRGQKFHIAITTWVGSKSQTGSEFALEGLTIQRGRAGVLFSDHLFWFLIPKSELQKGIAPERLIYTVENIRKMLENYYVESIDGNGIYKSTDYEQVLKSDTLYVKENDLSYYFRTPELLKPKYPYPFRIATEEQWLRAVSEQRPNVLFLDYFRSGDAPLPNGGWAHGYYNTANIYQAKGGRLIISMYPIKGMDRKLKGPEFKKFAK
jgi:hypothetical protein